MRRPRIQVLLDDAVLTPDMHGALEQIGAQVDCLSLPIGTFAPLDSPHDARLVVTSQGYSGVRAKLAGLDEWLEHQACATLVLAEQPGGGEMPGEEPAEYWTVEYASNLSRDDLAGRLAAMCALRGPMDRMRRELELLRSRDAESRRSLRRVGNELKLAAAIQHDLLPSSIPSGEDLEIRVLYKPADVVSGDMYDLKRLDDTLLAISLADASGHGLAAGMLSAFAKRSFDGCETVNGINRLLEPNDLLKRLNRELLNTRFRECQFVAALYAIYDESTRVVRWARGGVPYPILVRDGAAPRRIASDGPVVGACPGAEFEVVELRLDPGDTLVFHTDGLDALMLDGRRDLGCDELDRTEWFMGLADLALEQSLKEVESRLSSRNREAGEVDDTTIVALHVPAEVPSFLRGEDMRPGLLCSAAG